MDSQSERCSNIRIGLLPSDFAAYLPWACRELDIEEPIMVVKIIQCESNFGSSVDQKRSRSQRTKHSQSITKTDLDVGIDKEESSLTAKLAPGGRYIKIWATYDKYQNLVQIDVDKRSTLTRKVLKVICLLLPLQTYLQSVTIRCRIDKYTVPEICHVLGNTFITDICLDNLFLPEANFYLLLDEHSSLRNLSLSRCKLNDEALKLIAERLIYPKSSSKTLTFLNLSSNSITDLGAKYLGQALRSNRQLNYLNLAANLLTDTGAGYILDTLLEFPLTIEEVTSKRSRHIEFLRHRDEMIQQAMKDMTEDDKIKHSTPTIAADKKTKISRTETSATKKTDNDKGTSCHKAMTIFEKNLDVFKDPFCDNTFVKEDHLYSYGNNVLCYLNLAFNELSFLTAGKVLEILKYQKVLDRKPRGLLKVCLDGNPLPRECREIKEIDELFENAMLNTGKKPFPNVARRKSVKNI